MPATVRKLPPLAILLAVSLLLRLGAWFWVVSHNVPPTFDETYYAARTEAFAAVLRDLSTGRAPVAATLDRAYGHGVWPPLHPLLMAPGWLLGGLAGARLTVVLASWLTTLLLVRLSRAIGLPERVALLAGWLHALLPETLAYSHYLWSETTFTLWVAAALLACARGFDARGARACGYAAAAGMLAGLAGLCRASVTPLALLLAAGWWRRGGWRAAGLARGLLFLGLCLLTLSPWLAVLHRREGRWVPLSTAGDYNFYIGNNPLVQRELGSAWGTTATEAYRELLRGIIDRHYGGDEAAYRRDPRGSDLARGFSFREPARGLALAHIRRDPAGAVRRALLRLWLLPGPDMFMVRHLLNLAYPPLAAWLVAGLWGLSWGGHLVLLGGLSAGLACRTVWRRAGGLAAAALTLAAPVALTISVSRMRFATTVLLLPVAAAGLLALAGAWRRPGGLAALPRPRLAAAALAALLFWIAALHAGRASLRYHFTPSTAYARLVGALAPLAGRAPVFTETLVLARTPEGPQRVVVALEPEGAVVFDTPARQTMQALDLRRGSARFRIESRTTEPVVLRLADPERGACARVVVLAGRQGWRQPRPTGIPGLGWLVEGANGL